MKVNNNTTDTNEYSGNVSDDELFDIVSSALDFQLKNNFQDEDEASVEVASDAVEEATPKVRKVIDSPTVPLPSISKVVANPNENIATKTAEVKSEATPSSGYGAPELVIKTVYPGGKNEGESKATEGAYEEEAYVEEAYTEEAYTEEAYTEEAYTEEAYSETEGEAPYIEEPGDFNYGVKDVTGEIVYPHEDEYIEDENYEPEYTEEEYYEGDYQEEAEGVIYADEGAEEINYSEYDEEEYEDPALEDYADGSEHEDKDYIIDVRKVTLIYPNGTVALKNISLKIEKGEFVFIVGSSGSGKSSLIKTLLGELKPTSGNIFVDGRDIASISLKQLPYYRRKLGVVFQEFRLLEDRNVFENVELSQRVIGIPRDKRRKNCLNMFKAVGLEAKIHEKTSELSGGEQQRVAIARAMVNKPPILLADEPTGNLDPNNSREIMKILEDLNKIGTTVVIVTHNDTLVNEMQKRVITLHNGTITNDEQGGYVQ